MADSPYCQHPICFLNDIEEDVEHFILYCPAYTNYRVNMKQKLNSMGITQLNLETLLLSEELYPKKHEDILLAFLKYLHETNRAHTYF